ncbi:MAG: efflux RND transporter periplasmic adaptor subunit [Desulfuromonas sp.]|nr:efflux RND transporter periplasmic adaptor subunit [Desulfuromonas sp.]
MKRFPLQTRTLALVVVLLPLLALFIYVSLRSGPLAPVPVTLTQVSSRAISPALFGIGTVDVRYSYKIGPTVAGRIAFLNVHVGDQVKAGQILGGMDPVDLDERIRAQQSAQKRAVAQLDEAQARLDYAQTQAQRYADLLGAKSTSEEIVATKKFELQIARTTLSAAHSAVAQIDAELAALKEQRNNLALVAAVDGLITARNADPGTTIVAGQAVLEMINPQSLWIDVRFDQTHAQGLKADLAAQIVLRSQQSRHPGRVLRVEPLADAVTEEMLAKVVFDQIPAPLPAIGELTEVTVMLPELPAGPVIPNAAIKHVGGKLGVWQRQNGELHFAAVTLGASDLDGYVQVLDGVDIGAEIIVYSTKALSASSRIHVVDSLLGAKS